MRTRQQEQLQTPARELLKVLAIAPSNELAILWLQQRKREHDESGLNALMDKYDAAREAGLDLNEADKARLLALLFESVLEGVGGWTI
jgi:hypothetical protein